LQWIPGLPNPRKQVATHEVSRSLGAMSGLTSVWIDRHGRGGEPNDVLAITSLTELPGHIRALAG